MRRLRVGVLDLVTTAPGRLLGGVRADPVSHGDPPPLGHRPGGGRFRGGRFHGGEDRADPEFYRALIRRDLGTLYPFVPEGALEHDPNTYLKAVSQAPPPTIRLRTRAGTGGSAAPAGAGPTPGGEP